MAMTVQQIHPVAHLPLVLGVLRRLAVAPVIDRLIPYSTPALVWSRGRSLGPRDSGWASCPLQGRGNGWKSGGWWRCCKDRDSHAPRSNDYRLGHIMARRCLRPISTRCMAPLLSTHWKSMPLPHHGCIRTRRLLPCGACADRPGPRGPGGMAIAKTVVMISNGCSSVSGSAAMAVSRCASGCGTAAAVIVWRRRWRIECLAVGCEGVRGIVADSKAYSRRTLGLCLGMDSG